MSEIITIIVICTVGLSLYFFYFLKRISNRPKWLNKGNKEVPATFTVAHYLPRQGLEYFSDQSFPAHPTGIYQVKCTLGRVNVRGTDVGPYTYVNVGVGHACVVQVRQAQTSFHVVLYKQEEGVLKKEN